MLKYVNCILVATQFGTMKPQRTYLIETERLRLREMTPNDAGFAFQLNSDEEVIRYTGDKSFNTVDEVRQFLSNYKDYELHGIGRWGVELKATGELIGWTGLKYLVEEDVVDLGYRFFKKEWNKGYATEASAACISYGFEHLNIKRIIAYVMEANIGSIKVAEKLNMKRVAIGKECGGTTFTYELLNPNSIV